MKSIFGFWECEYCDTRFTKEPAYNKHRCEMMERAEFIDNTKRGRFAYMVYNEYMMARGYIKQSKQVFRESKSYNSILKFAEFYYSAMLPDMKDYVNFVVKEIDLLPQYWVRSDVYERYISEFDERVTPLQQAEITFKHLATMAKGLECEPAEVFDYIYVTELAKLIQSRRVSPWVLLASERFIQYLDDCSDTERPIVEMMVNEDLWLPRFRKDPKARKTILALTKEFGI